MTEFLEELFTEIGHQTYHILKPLSILSFPLPNKDFLTHCGF